MATSIEQNERIAQIDATVVSPQERAQQVYKILQENAPNLSSYDLLCFAVEICALSVQAYPWLEQPARELNKLVYTAHYFAGDKIGLYTVSEDGKTIEPLSVLPSQQNESAANEG